MRDGLYITLIIENSGGHVMASNTVTVTIDARPAIDAIAEAQELIRSHASLRAEVEALKAKAAAFDEWHAKTEWVQETAEARELGMHRADVMRKRIEALRKAAQSVLDSAVDSEREALGLDELRRALEGGE